MLTSEAGLAVMRALMFERGIQHAAVVGAANLHYWQALLGGVPQIPHLYSALGIRQQHRGPSQNAPPHLPSEAQPERGMLTAKAVEAAIARTASDVLGVSSLIANQPLASQGLDSLAGLELRHKLQAWFCAARKFASTPQGLELCIEASDFVSCIIQSAVAMPLACCRSCWALSSWCLSKIRRLQLCSTS